MPLYSLALLNNFIHTNIQHILNSAIRMYKLIGWLLCHVSVFQPADFMTKIKQVKTNGKILPANGSPTTTCNKLFVFIGIPVASCLLHAVMMSQDVTDIFESKSQLQWGYCTC